MRGTNFPVWYHYLMTNLLFLFFFFFLFFFTLFWTFLCSYFLHCFSISTLTRVCVKKIDFIWFLPLLTFSGFVFNKRLREIFHYLYRVANTWQTFGTHVYQWLYLILTSWIVQNDEWISKNSFPSHILYTVRNFSSMFQKTW